MGELRPAYKPHEAARILGRSKAWIIEKAPTDLGRAMGAHRTPSVEDRGHWLFDPDVFDRYVRDLRAGRSPRLPKKTGRKSKSSARQPRNVAMNAWLEEFKKAG